LPASKLACLSLFLAEARDFRVPDGFGRFLSLKPATFGFLKVSVAFCRCSEELSDGCRYLSLSLAQRA
ncbi:hypothetical protein A2U01_0097764, partial [Trifolium medium]|nr:hypothetical protein [Trifolium medium]